MFNMNASILRRIYMMMFVFKCDFLNRDNIDHVMVNGKN